MKRFEPKSVSRWFPRLAWAWPKGARHQLITAAICPDEDRAFAAIQQWLHDTDLDDATFAEHRLLAAITTRFDQRLKPHAEYARLCGLQRLNWTKSRMAVGASKPALEHLVNAGLRVVLLKGACRVALDLAEQKSRTSYDLDLLVNPNDFSQGFEILAKDGWNSARGESVLGLRARLSSIRARNFKKGRFGDIDLHKTAYHTANSHAALDDALFQEAQPAEFYGLNVFIPSPEERIAMAIGHGGWDGHSHSDWLVDVAGILEKESIDWDKFTIIINGRNLKHQTAIALSYLANDIGLDIPTPMLDAVCRWRVASAPSRVAVMFLAKEHSSMTLAQKAVRSVFHTFHRARYSGRDKDKDTSAFRAFTKRANASDKGAYVFKQTVPAKDTTQAGIYAFKISIEIPAQKRRRRIEFELNGAQRNICHLQALHLRKSDVPISARFHGKIQINPNDWPLSLEALPGKFMFDEPTPADREKYGELPFKINSVILRRED
ncbi:nucleotidyltransferase family protein [Pacificibacter marinus]|uniref:Nucleotidyltransferase family protein n=1 Tax=Pacificibacter marinus TaxID=658057 RepID=A0A1Y5TR64_9RHOB|nr:nucleotidyltransferase family protein [Pacificibacter marinus]SEK55173.1 Uncharacterised nucleotidyltransferase [Pacificibacter marinus]SLN67842.1 hypothetical protein PAM7971_03597 [Pacificibacter marinus]